MITEPEVIEKHTIMDYNRITEKQKNKSCKKQDGLPVIGFFFIGLGIVFLLDRLHLIPNEWRSIIISWQVLLIFIGTINIFRNHARFPGLILILVGTAFILPEIVHIPFETKQLLWPLIMIIVGAAILLKGKHFKTPHIFNQNQENHVISEKIDEVAIFGGGKRVITTQNLQGGNITAIFGGLEIDLSDAEIQDDVIILEVAAIFGGATIIVKPEWDVQVQVSSIMGGFSDKRKVYKNDSKEGAKRLIIKGAAIFGGGEVKSF